MYPIQAQSENLVRCPLMPHQVFPEGCILEQCVYHSIRRDTGCSYGSPISIQTYARNKGIRRRIVEEDMEHVHKQVQHAMLIYAYVQFCEEIQYPTKKDRKDYKRVRPRLPYSIPAIATIFNPKKMAAMKDLLTFRNFCKKQRITMLVPLKEFLFENSVMLSTQAYES